MAPLYCYSAKVLSVYDGDTCTLLIDIGFSIHIKEKVRFLGLDCPEIRTRDKEEKKKGLLVKQFVKDLIEGKEVIIKTTKRGKFGRYLVEIFINGKSLNKMLINKKYAKPYFGGKRG